MTDRQNNNAAYGKRIIHDATITQIKTVTHSILWQKTTLGEKGNGKKMTTTTDEWR
jgi:hypothetical protein